MDVWRAVVTALVLIVGALAALAVVMINGFASQWRASHAGAEQRDEQRAEIQENVRRIANGKGVQHDGEEAKRSKLSDVRPDGVACGIAFIVTCLLGIVWVAARVPAERSARDLDG